MTCEQVASSSSDPMSVLISSSPPLPSLFLDRYHDNSASLDRYQYHENMRHHDNMRHDDHHRATIPRTAQHTTFLDAPFRPRLSSTFIKKKVVVFADSLGLPLTQVKMLQSEETIESSPPWTAPLQLLSPSVPLKPSLKLNFPQPISRLDFLEEVRVNHVSLENVLVADFSLTGTVLVHNISYEKAVTVRYTRNYWLSHDDIIATYARSVAPDIDKFSFNLELLSTLPAGTRVELCVCAAMGGEEFWDSNNDKNYQIECVLLPRKPGNQELFATAEIIRRKLGKVSSGLSDIYY